MQRTNKKNAPCTISDVSFAETRTVPGCTEARDYQVHSDTRGKVEEAAEWLGSLCGLLHLFIAYAMLMHVRLCTTLTPRPKHNGLLHAALDIPRGLPSYVAALPLSPRIACFSWAPPPLSAEVSSRPYTRANARAPVSKRNAPREPAFFEIYARAQVPLCKRRARARVGFSGHTAVNLTLKMLLNSIFIDPLHFVQFQVFFYTWRNRAVPERPLAR